MKCLYYTKVDYTAELFYTFQLTQVEHWKTNATDL